ncbi:RNA 2',3'-cyclic phosphodiesterase [Actinomadura rayongensis]|uniref:RNA 2',3'-cyclic phosphodiesterase n=1 Tax=Actinomadura rayongensis TaxID=1429076 RepID=A0A6I4W8Y3_9ACTN|nr:RNA 2',3'-cyclic phosphodiesterase [Actinomadura rayongensis]MXQ64725.1 RNA 2',3'-cyclic phosphodiesterase [Actinomadura rayongensis]
MRLFAALVPPPAVLDAVERFTAPLRAGTPAEPTDAKASGPGRARPPGESTSPELRWIDRDLLHVTLAFFGDLDPSALDVLIPKLERAAERHPCMRLTLAGGGAFPLGGQYARVLWAGLYGDRRALAGLAAATAAAGHHAGAAPDHHRDQHRAYRPHLTLARSRGPVDVRPLLEPLATFATKPWTAEEFHLIHSHLPAPDRPHPEYEPLATFRLCGTA